MLTGCVSCDTVNRMKTAAISRGGQISIPAEVRRRWKSTRVLIDDRGDALVIRPIPADPIRAAMGSLAPGSRSSSEDARRRARREEAEAEDRRFGHP